MWSYRGGPRYRKIENCHNFVNIARIAPKHIGIDSWVEFGPRNTIRGICKKKIIFWIFGTFIPGMPNTHPFVSQRHPISAHPSLPYVVSTKIHNMKMAVTHKKVTGTPEHVSKQLARIRVFRKLTVMPFFSLFLFFSYDCISTLNTNMACVRFSCFLSNGDQKKIFFENNSDRCF